MSGSKAVVTRRIGCAALRLMPSPKLRQHGPGFVPPRTIERGCMGRLLMCGSMDRLPGRMGPFVCGSMGRLHFAVAWTACWPPGKLSDCMGRLSLCGSMDRLLSLSAVAWTVLLGSMGQCAAAWAVFLCAVAWTVFYLAAWASVRLHGPSLLRGCMDRLYYYYVRLHGPSLLRAAAWAVFIDYHAAALADFIMTMTARRCTHPEVTTLTTKPSHAVS